MVGLLQVSGWRDRLDSLRLVHWDRALGGDSGPYGHCGAFIVHDGGRIGWVTLDFGEIWEDENFRRVEHLKDLLGVKGSGNRTCYLYRGVKFKVSAGLERVQVLALNKLSILV